jgi:hypothetical protein
LLTEISNHLPEGNSWLHISHHLGGTARDCLQREMNMRRVAHANNAESRMSAMRGPHAELICKTNFRKIIDVLSAARDPRCT